MKKCTFGTLSENTRQFLILASIGMLALAVRGMVAQLTNSWAFSTDHNSWSFGYEMGQIAASLALGDGFRWPEWGALQGPTAWMPPIYPFLMGATFKIFGIYSHQAAIVLLSLQTILSLLTCVWLYRIGKEVFNAQVGLLAAFFFAIYPAAIHFDVQKVWSTSLFSCCLVIMMLCLLKLRTEMNVTRALSYGGLAGFTALVDPIVVASYPFALIWLYVNAKASRIATGKIMAVVLAVCFLTISPWLIRNYIVFGQFVFIKSNFGQALFWGNHAGATGSYEDPEPTATLTPTEKQALEFGNEATRNRLSSQKALAFISAHPLEFLKLTAHRFVGFWTFMMRPVEGRQQIASLLIYFGVLVLAIISLFLSNLRAPGVQLMWLFVMALPLPYYITAVGLFRYRFPVETVLMIPAAYTAYRAFVAVGARRDSTRNKQEPAERGAAAGAALAEDSGRN